MCHSDILLCHALLARESEGYKSLLFLFEPEVPAEFVRVEPGDIDAEPPRFGRRRVAAALAGAKDKRARTFAELVEPIREPRPWSERLGEHYGSSAEQRELGAERRVHLLDRRLEAVCRPIALDRLVQIADDNHDPGDAAEVSRGRFAAGERAFLARRSVTDEEREERATRLGTHLRGLPIEPNAIGSIAAAFLGLREDRKS